MAVSFSVPASPEKSKLVINEFLGVDFTSSPERIDIRRSPNGKNMIRSVPGKVRKSMGYKEVDGTNWFDTSTVISQMFHYSSGIVGADDFLIATNKGTYYARLSPQDPMQSGVKWSNDKNTHINWILDTQYGAAFATPNKIGTSRLNIANIYGDMIRLLPITNYAYIPTVSISRNPGGGGVPYESVNLLGDGFKDSFRGDVSVKQYQLSFSGLKAAASGKYVSAQIMTSSGGWRTVSEESNGLTVDRNTGVVTFVDAPGASPIIGEDNIIITAYKDFNGYEDRLANCTECVLLGTASGGNVAVFSGNPTYNYRNYVWFSQPNDFTYVPDTNYALAGNRTSRVNGLGTSSGLLTVFKDSTEKGNNVFFYKLTTIEGNNALQCVTAAAAEPNIAPKSIGYLNGELLYLTDNGIYAISTQEYTSDKVSQKRGYYLDGKLNKESLADRENAQAITYKGMYILLVNNQFYILDGEQPVYDTESNQYNTRQYCAFYRDNINSKMLSTDGKELFIGIGNKICTFHSDTESLESYNDLGEPIVAEWETPDIVGQLFYKNKTLRYIALKVQSALATSVKTYVMERGLWNYQNEDVAEIWDLLKEDDTFARYFQFTKIIFSKFSFSTDKTQRISRVKTRIKKVDKFRLKFTNDKLNEPFEICDIAMEFIENGNYKG